MLCQNCKQNQANVHFHLNLNGQTKKMALCNSCYKAERNKISSSFGGSPFKNGFGNFDDLFKQFQSSIPNEAFKQQPGSQPQTAQGGGHGGGFLDQYGKNLNDMAKAGLIDPVIGRDKEIKRVIEVLNRRNKNNPVLIGEPGVGKQLSLKD